VLNDFFDVEPLIDDTNYPFICKTAQAPIQPPPR
jgi:hypothetical protein